MSGKAGPLSIQSALTHRWPIRERAFGRTFQTEVVWINLVPLKGVIRQSTVFFRFSCLRRSYKRNRLTSAQWGKGRSRKTLINIPPQKLRRKGDPVSFFKNLFISLPFFEGGGERESYHWDVDPSAFIKKKRRKGEQNKSGGSRDGKGRGRRT